ncbi:MAG TPA: hypothetical protein VFS28_02845 [Gemmatimonadales bacterium]|nr:hypothetical protein [Gemmatimonadales bacterium]
MRRLLLSLVFLLPATLSAQVGVDPAHSPYRDITKPNAFVFSYGHIGGNGGAVGVGPRDGDAWAFRYDVRFSGLLGGHIGFGHFIGTRYAYNPDDSASKRRTGPFDQGVTFIGGGIHLNLTGPKTWHRLAPYVEGEIGAAVGSKLTADSASAYAFGTKLYVNPGVGVQWFISDRIRLRFEAHRIYWKLTYPVTFYQTPLAEPTAAPIRSGSTTEWTGNGWLSLGVAISPGG